MHYYLSGMRHGYRICRCGLLALLPLLILGACQQQVVDDEQLIRQRLAAMANAVEQNQASVFLEGVDAGFLGQGRLRKGNLAGLLMLQWRQHPSISVRLDNIEIERQDQQATVTFIAQLHGKGGWLSQGERLLIQSRWKKVEGQWLVERARWRRHSDAD